MTQKPFEDLTIPEYCYSQFRSQNRPARCTGKRRFGYILRHRDASWK